MGVTGSSSKVGFMGEEIIGLSLAAEVCLKGIHFKRK